MLYLQSEVVYMHPQSNVYIVVFWDGPSSNCGLLVFNILSLCLRNFQLKRTQFSSVVELQRRKDNMYIKLLILQNPGWTRCHLLSYTCPMFLGLASSLEWFLQWSIFLQMNLVSLQKFLFHDLICVHPPEDLIGELYVYCHFKHLPTEIKHIFHFVVNYMILCRCARIHFELFVWLTLSMF